MSDKAPLPPTTLVIFGITGNLASQKLLPALYHLMRLNMLPEHFNIVGTFRSTKTNLDAIIRETEINLLRRKQDVDPEILKKLRAMIQPIMMDSTNPDDFASLRALLEKFDADQNVVHNRLYYLAIPPAIFKKVVDCLAQAGLNASSPECTSRLLVEKPFGTDLASAHDLIDFLAQHFDESQMYRIDHYLAKETAQNILTFRFSNPLVEDMWGRQFIDHIQITAAESIGIEGRAAFYEGMGALRDLVQSHLLQLLALITMEAPQTLTSADIHAEKLALLQSIVPIEADKVAEVAVRGQYEGYRTEVENALSNVETFAALKLEIANSRWGGVPILVRTGKALTQKTTEISVVFKNRARRSLPDNVLTIRLQPNEGISLKLTAKKPGFSDELQPVLMNFSYQDSFGDVNPDAYERVLIDAINGDQSLFATSDEVIRCWEILEAVLKTWQSLPEQPEVYAIGSSGPAAADALAKEFGIEWKNA